MLRIAPPDEDDEKDEGRYGDMNSEAEDEDAIPHEEVLEIPSLYTIKFKVVEMVDEEPRSLADEEVTPEGMQMLDKISKVNRQQHLNGKVRKRKIITPNFYRYRDL